MTRLPPLNRDALTPEQRALVEAVESGPRAARHGSIGLAGPFGVWLHAPVVGDAAQRFGAVVRFGTTLAEHLKEIAICTVGAHFKARFEFAAHAPLAIAAGVDPVAIEAIRRGSDPNFSAAEETLAHEIARTLLNEHRISDALYRRARSVFNETQLVELVTVIGYYCQISLTLNAFEVPLAPGMADPFPDAP